VRAASAGVSLRAQHARTRGDSAGLCRRSHRLPPGMTVQALAGETHLLGACEVLANAELPYSKQTCHTDGLVESAGRSPAFCPAGFYPSAKWACRSAQTQSVLPATLVETVLCNPSMCIRFLQCRTAKSCSWASDRSGTCMPALCWQLPGAHALSNGPRSSLSVGPRRRQLPTQECTQRPVQTPGTARMPGA